MLRRLALLALTAASLLPLCMPAAAGTGPVRIDVGPHAPLSIIVRSFGWLDDAARGTGRAIAWVDTRTLEDAAQGLAADRLDVATTGGALALAARSGGVPIKAVYVAWKGAGDRLALVSMRESLIATDPGAARQVLQAYERARRWALAHPEDAAQLVADWERSPLVEAVARMKLVDFTASAPGPSQAVALRRIVDDHGHAAIDGLLDRDTARSALAAVPLKRTQCATFCDQW